MNIPTDWTFKSDEIANGFDEHVREQLPWYELVTKCVSHFGRHYIPENGIVYDIGASTGNIGKALRDTIESRKASLIAIENSDEMAIKYDGPGSLAISDACEYDYQPFDFAVLLLTLMFLPVGERPKLIQRLIRSIKPGGCLIIVDKTDSMPGYFGTAMRRLSMRWKIDNGVDPKKILEKELSLAGYQRPINPAILTPAAKKFFQLGEFSGWVIESQEPA